VPIDGNPAVDIQDALTPNGPWHELGTVGTGSEKGCTGAGFNAQGPAEYSRAYYRAGNSTHLVAGAPIVEVTTRRSETLGSHLRSARVAREVVRNVHSMGPDTVIVEMGLPAWRPTHPSRPGA
jgi:hypothetical protein